MQRRKYVLQYYGTRQLVLDLGVAHNICSSRFVYSIYTRLSVSFPMDDAALDEWLFRHIPHRIRAAIAGLPVQDDLLTGLSVTDPQAIRARCDANAICEGRLATIRWLIEFIGVRQDKHGKPARPMPYDATASVTMISGGTHIDLQSPEAIFLARVWKGCSQASSHATHASGHPPVGAAELDRAIRIVTAHLDRTIYAAHHCKIAAASLHVDNR